MSVDWSAASDLYSNGNVTWKSAADLTGTGGIAQDAVDTNEIVTGAVTADELGFDAVNESHVDSGALGQGIGGGSGDTINIGAGTGLNRDSTSLSIDTTVVPRKDQADTIEGYWTFDKNVTIKGDLNLLGNFTETDVQELSVNGSLLPPQKFNKTFDVGSNTRWWRDGYFSGNIHVSGNVDGVDVGNPDSSGAISIDSGNNGYQVNVDDSTIEINSDALRVKSGGIGNNELDNTADFEVGSLNVTSGNLNLSFNDLVGVGGTQCGSNQFIDGNGNCVTDSDTANTDNQNLKEVLVQGNVANDTIDMDTNDITDIGSGRTNITSTGKVEAGDNVDMNDNAVDNAQAYNLGNGMTMKKDGNDIVISDS